MKRCEKEITVRPVHPYERWVLESGILGEDLAYWRVKLLHDDVNFCLVERKLKERGKWEPASWDDIPSITCSRLMGWAVKAFQEQRRIEMEVAEMQKKKSDNASETEVASAEEVRAVRDALEKPRKNKILAYYTSSAGKREYRVVHVLEVEDPYVWVEERGEDLMGVERWVKVRMKEREREFLTELLEAFAAGRVRLAE